jgi:hypothetical protein
MPTLTLTERSPPAVELDSSTTPDWSPFYVWWLSECRPRLISTALILACFAAAEACTFALGYLCGWI